MAWFMVAMMAGSQPGAEAGGVALQEQAGIHQIEEGFFVGERGYRVAGVGFEVHEVLGGCSRIKASRIGEMLTPRSRASCSHVDPGAGEHLGVQDGFFDGFVDPAGEGFALDLRGWSQG